MDQCWVVFTSGERFRASACVADVLELVEGALMRHPDKGLKIPGIHGHVLPKHVVRVYPED